MGKKEFNLIQMLKSVITALGWHLFLWGIGKTDEEYWTEIAEQEAGECLNLMSVRKNRDGSFFLALPDFVSLQESPAIFVERESMARFLSDNARNQDEERAFWEALDGKVEWK